MAIFTRSAKILESDGAPMHVRTALTLINQTLDEVLAEQEGDFDADTGWAVAWFDQFGFNDGPFGDAETLCKAKNTAIGGLQEAGIALARAGKVRLLRPDELPVHWDPAIDPRLTAWEVLHQLIRALEAGGCAAAALVAQLGSHAGAVASWPLRLYTRVSARSASEAPSYNAGAELAGNRAAGAETPQATPVQTDLPEGSEHEAAIAPDETTFGMVLRAAPYSAALRFGSQLKGTVHPDSDIDCWWSSSRARCRVCWHWPAWNWSFPSYWAVTSRSYGRRDLPDISATRWCVRQRCSMLAEDSVRRATWSRLRRVPQLSAGRQRTDLERSHVTVCSGARHGILGEAASKISKRRGPSIPVFRGELSSACVTGSFTLTSRSIPKQVNSDPGNSRTTPSRWRWL
jgi:hypothetical protein